MIDYTFLSKNKVRIRFADDNINAPEIKFYNRYGDLLIPDNIVNTGDNVYTMDYDEKLYYDDYFHIFVNGESYINHIPEKFDDYYAEPGSDEEIEEQENFEIEFIEKDTILYDDWNYSNYISYNRTFAFVNFLGTKRDALEFNDNDSLGNSTNDWDAPLITRQELNDILSSPQSAYDVSGQTFVVKDENTVKSYLITSDKENVNFEEYDLSSNLSVLRKVSTAIPTSTSIVKNQEFLHTNVELNSMHNSDATSNITSLKNGDLYRGQARYNFRDKFVTIQTTRGTVSTLEERMDDTPDIYKIAGYNRDAEITTYYELLRKVKDINGTEVLGDGQHVASFVVTE